MVKNQKKEEANNQIEVVQGNVPVVTVQLLVEVNRNVLLVAEAVKKLIEVVKEQNG